MQLGSRQMSRYFKKRYAAGRHDTMRAQCQISSAQQRFPLVMQFHSFIDCFVSPCRILLCRSMTTAIDTCCCQHSALYGGLYLPACRTPPLSFEFCCCKHHRCRCTRESQSQMPCTRCWPTALRLRQVLLAIPCSQCTWRQQLWTQHAPLCTRGCSGGGYSALKLYSFHMEAADVVVACIGLCPGAAACHGACTAANSMATISSCRCCTKAYWHICGLVHVAWWLCDD